MELGRADAALELAKAYLATRPPNAEALTIKGEALLAKKQLPDALDALESAVKLDSGNIRALKLSGDLYALLGANDLALQHYAKALARKPGTDAEAKLVAAAKEARARLIEKLAGKSQQ
jgi:tetratricopeptide (TPR) repeat protein